MAIFNSELLNYQRVVLKPMVWGTPILESHHFPQVKWLVLCQSLCFALSLPCSAGVPVGQGYVPNHNELLDQEYPEIETNTVATIFNVLYSGI